MYNLYRGRFLLKDDSALFKQVWEYCPSVSPLGRNLSSPPGFCWFFLLFHMCLQHVPIPITIFQSVLLSGFSFSLLLFFYCFTLKLNFWGIQAIENLSLFAKALYILVFTSFYMCGPMWLVVCMYSRVCVFVSVLAGSSKFFVKCVRSFARNVLLFGVVHSHVAFSESLFYGDSKPTHFVFIQIFCLDLLVQKKELTNNMTQYLPHYDRCVMHLTISRQI